MEAEVFPYGQKVKALSCAFNRLINAHSAAMELTGAQGMILGYLAHHQDNPVYPKDIERHFDLSHPTVSGLLQRLESKGFITFTVAPQDRRCKCIAMTQKALDNDARVRALMQSVDEQLVQGFTPEERWQFWNLLSRAAENVTPPKEGSNRD